MKIEIIKNGEEAHCYKPFPLLLGQASTEGIAQRLELSIRNSRETLRVWWGESAYQFDAITSAAPTKMPIHPPNIDIDKNVQEAKNMTYTEFYSAVRTGGKWDYKNIYGSQYEDFGNFHFGVVGSAIGLSEQILLRGAGWYQERGPAADPNFGHWYGNPPYGDDPRDQVQIKRGIEYYEIKYS